MNLLVTGCLGLMIAAPVPRPPVQPPPIRDAEPAVPYLYGKKIGEWLLDLREEDSVTRQQAATTLGEFSDHPEIVVPALIGAINDQDISVRRAAYRSLGMLGTKAKEVAPTMLYRLQFVNLNSVETTSLVNTVPRITDQGSRIVLEAYLRQRWVQFGRARGPRLESVFEQYPDRFVPEFIFFLRDHNPEVRSRALSLVKLLFLTLSTSSQGELRTAILDGVEQALESERVHTEAMLNFLVSYGPNDRAKWVKLAMRLVEEERLEPRQASHLLRPNSIAAVEPLLALYLRSKPERQAAWIAAFGNLNDSCVPPLIEVLKHSDPAMRTAAILALGTQAESATVICPALVPMLDDKAESVRRAAAKVLAKLDPVNGQKTIPILRTMLDDPNALVGEEVVRLLGTMKAVARPAIPELLIRLKDDDIAVRVYAAIAIRSIDATVEREVVPALVEALCFPKSLLPRLCVDELTAIGPTAREAAPWLLSAFPRTDDDFHLLLTRTIHRVDPTIVPLAVKLLLKDAVIHDARDTDHAFNLYPLLAELGSAAEEAVPHLLRVMRTTSVPEKSTLAACTALAIAPRKSTVARNFIREKMLDEKSAERFTTTALMYEVVPSAVIEELRTALTEGKPPIRLAIIAALRECQSSLKKLVPMLEEAAKKNDQLAQVKQELLEMAERLKRVKD